MYIFISNLSSDIGYLLSTKLEKSYIVYQEDYLFKHFHPENVESLNQENMIDRYNWYSLNSNLITLKDKFDFIIISGNSLLLNFIKISPDVCINDIKFNQNKDEILQQILDRIL